MPDKIVEYVFLACLVWLSGVFFVGGIKSGAMEKIPENSWQKRIEKDAQWMKIVFIWPVYLIYAPFYIFFFLGKLCYKIHVAVLGD